MKRYVTLFFLIAIISAPAYAQFYSTKYRVPGQQWMELRSDRFRLIYPERYRSEALRSMSILEAEYADIQNLVGGNLNNFPVILNPENDRSNGFVTSFNFRSEIELAPIRGKALSPKSGDWLESVLPHELVHALHFSVNPLSLTRILGLFSPDMRRSIHGAAPAGFLEGIAVEHESHGTIPNSGRGNYPYFSNQFNSLLNSDDEWSMGQLVHISDYTLPFNRHYIGGYEFTHWLQNSHGEEAFRRAIEFHYKYPFLGFGVALRAVTGKWPASLYRDFSNESKAAEQKRLDSLDRETDSASFEILFNAECRRMQRPLWLDDNTLLFYGRSCNKPQGIYTYSLATADTKLIKEVVLTESADYSLTNDKSRLYYARYHIDSIYDNVFRGDLHELDILSGKSQRISKGLRLFSPDYSDDQLYATQTAAHELELVQVDPGTGTVLKEFEKSERSSVIDIESNPADPNKLAIIGRKQGVQAVWFYNKNTDFVLFEDHPDISFENGSVFDLQWHPSGEKLLFVSDHTGTMDVYEYSVSERQVSRLTQSMYNAFEPSYSPDGNQIAYVFQKENEQVVRLLNLDNALHEVIPVTNWQATDGIIARLDRNLMNRESLPESSSWETSELRSGLSWLKPRLWTPIVEKENNNYRFGVTLESADIMSSRSYSLEATQYLNRAWYDLTYRHKGFYPGYQLEAFNRPFLTNIRITRDDQEFIRTFLQQSRGAALKIPFRIRLKSNARFSSILIEPQYFLSQLRFLDPQSTSTAYSDFGNRHSIGLRTVLNYNIRRFFRDVQPNSGWVLFTESRYGLNDSELNISTNEFNILANLTDRRGFRGGVSTFIAPLRKWNQSLRLTAQVVSQTDLPVFNTASLYSDTFLENPFPVANNVSIFDTRYTIPIVYPDEGGVLLPVYLSNIYLVFFTQTVTDLNSQNLAKSSRAVYGAGIRSRFRLSNLAFDIGISFGFEPTRNQFTWYAGSF